MNKPAFEMNVFIPIEQSFNQTSEVLKTSEVSQLHLDSPLGIVYNLYAIVYEMYTARRSPIGRVVFLAS